jgi:hypothetical protein
MNFSAAAREAVMATAQATPLADVGVEISARVAQSELPRRVLMLLDGSTPRL